MPTVADRAQCLRILAQVRPQLYAHNNGAGRLLRATRAVAHPDLTDFDLTEGMSDLCDLLTALSSATTRVGLAHISEREPYDAEVMAVRTAAYRVRAVLWDLLHGPDAVMCTGHAAVPGLPAEQMPAGTGPDELCDGCREEALAANGVPSAADAVITTDATGITVATIPAGVSR